MRFLCIAGIFLVFSGFLTPWGRVRGDASAPMGDKRKPCWVLNHMNKSGGQTLKFMLLKWLEERHVTVGLFDSAEWKNGTVYARKFLDYNFEMTWGAYAEGLRSQGVRPHCKWFTMFRHPVSRLVSAFYFCQTRVTDPLCAANVMRADEVDIYAFAEHWTNFGLRQFAHAFVSSDAVMSSKMARQCPDCPGWFLLKSYLDDVSERAAYVVPPSLAHDAALHHLLEPVELLLKDGYAAVGILEQYNSTLHLFNAALEMPGVDWPTAFRDLGVKNEDKLFGRDIRQAAKKLRTDARIKELLQLDLLLYEHAVAVHKAQVDAHGIR